MEGICGNGIAEPGEACDDGNVVDEGICDATCSVATCFVPFSHASLQAAVDDLACPVVWLAPGTYHEAVQITQPEHDDTVVQALEGSTATIDSFGLGRPVTVSGVDTTLRRLVLTGGDPGEGVNDTGGGLRSASVDNLLLEDVVITGNRSWRGGGAVISGQGNAVLDRVTISGNTAEDGAFSSSAGGLYISVSDVQLYDSVIEDNSAEGSGGGILMTSSVLLDGTRISNNHAVGGSGGGVSFSVGGDLVLQNGSEISGNTATGSGGGVNGFPLDVSVAVRSGSRIDDNTAGSRGGGVYLRARGTFIAEAATFSGNASLASSGGGAVYLGAGSTASVLDTLMGGNSSVSAGGAISMIVGSSGLNMDPTELVIERSLFRDNTAENGGAISAQGSPVNTAVIRVENSTFVGNEATEAGGVLRVLVGDNLQGSFHNCTLADNVANTGAVAHVDVASSSEVRFAASILAGNVAGDGASCEDVQGGVFASGGSNIVAECDCSMGVAPAGAPDLCVDPMLLPLADNGGLTQTRAISEMSPAYNGGPAAGCLDADGSVLDEDQRSASRLVDPPCDVGAFER